MMNKQDKYKKYSREELVEELETLKNKKYGLVWDKKNSQEMLDAFVNWENMPENFVLKQFPVLKEVKNKEIETGKEEPVNLLIEGDNYHSLAVLNFTHQDKIDCIYIDPPYNTGNNDFRYNDKFVEKEDPWRHSKWLSFMEKRLKLAKSLLKNSGAIFISIDENEVAQLKMLCDEIFGENNFESIISWRRRSNQPNDKAKMIAKVSEFILVYAKNSTHLKESKFFNTLSLSEKRIQAYSNPDNDPRGAWSTTPWCASRGQGGTKYEIITPTKIRYNETWLGTEDTFNNLLADKRIIFPNKGNGKPRKKVFLKEREEEGQSAINFWFGNVYGDNLIASAELNNIFGGDKVFDNPKPTSLIKTILKLKTNKNDLIVDFFAGSGTTGQAVLELNKEDKGSRRFILCTNDEELNNEGLKVKHKICSDVCYPRLGKVINGYKNLKGENVAGLHGNLKYFKTDFVGSDSTDKNKRDLVNKSAEMICIKEDIFDCILDKGADFKIYQKGKKFLGIIYDLDTISNFRKEAEKHKGNFVVYCFSYNEVTPEKEFSGLKNKYVLKPIPSVILRIYLEIFKK